MLLYVPVNSYGHGGTVSSTNHTFPGQAWTSGSQVISAHTFACNGQQPFLNESAEGSNYSMINLQESMGPDQDRTRDPGICSQTRICSQSSYRLRYTNTILLLLPLVYVSNLLICSHSVLSTNFVLSRCLCSVSWEGQVTKTLKQILETQTGAKWPNLWNIQLNEYYLGLVATKPVFWVSDKVRFKPVCSATETS